MAKNFFKILLIIFVTFNIAVFAQIKSADESLEVEFKLGLNLYNSYQYDEALNVFERITEHRDLNRKTTAALLMKGKCLLNLNEYDKSVQTLTALIENYPESKYIDEARITKAAVLLSKKNASNAFAELIAIIQNSVDADYISKAKSLAEKIALTYLNAEGLNKFLSGFTGIKTSPLLMLLQARLYLKQNDQKAAEEILLKIIKDFPSSEEYFTALTLHQDYQNKYEKPGSVIIGVLLPLSGNKLSSEAASAAFDILEGIKFAVSEYNRGRNEKIGLLLRDSKLEKEVIAKIKSEFENISSIKAIIGPLFSSEVRDAITEFRNTNIPIISPTATDDDLTFINNNFFQANPSFSFRGKIMAQYIYFVENKRSMGILNAIEGYSPILAAAFANEFERLGGEIVIRQTYQSNTFNLNEPVSRIAAFAGKLDGLYIPLSDKSNVTAILSQLVQHNLDLPLYGNQDWFLAKGYETSTALSNKLTFTSDYFIPYSDENFSEFNKTFYARTKKDASRNVLYGYDAAKYVLSIFDGKTIGREDVTAIIESGFITTGFHNNIAIDSARINKYLNIVRYRDGVFELIDRFRLGN
jgi:branched-chain amino acid transport system substrate-binding protein